MKALSIAATGMNAQQINLEVIANNIANINTTGYKRSRAEFSDLLYQVERKPGVPNTGNQAIVPEGAHIGLGVQLAAVRNLHEQGSLATTSNDLDIAIIGRGMLEIETPSGETLYSRAGSLNTNAEGTLVNIDGYEVAGGITFPENTSEVVISRSGQVFAREGTAIEMTEVGQLTLANFTNEAGLEPLGDNLFRQTAASGEAIIGAPNDEGYGYVQQGFLESSNVDPVKEITDLISAQRAYEMNSKVIKAADEMASTITQSLG